MVEDDHRVRGEADVVLQVVLAVILDVRVAVARGCVQAEAILRPGLERRIWAWPAVSVTEIDEDVGALGCRLDPRPRCARAVDLDDRGPVTAGLRRELAGVVAIRARAGLDRSNDDDDAHGRGIRRVGNRPDGTQCQERSGEHLQPAAGSSRRPLGALAEQPQHPASSLPEHRAQARRRWDWSRHGRIRWAGRGARAVSEAGEPARSLPGGGGGVRPRPRRDGAGR